MADTMTLEEVRGQLSSWFGGSEACVDVKACDRLGEMINALDAAIKQREQGAKDAARLDWLEAHPRLASIVIGGNATDCYLYGVSGAMGLKLREILDAAMAKESGNG